MQKSSIDVWEQLDYHIKQTKNYKKTVQDKNVLWLTAYPLSSSYFFLLDCASASEILLKTS